MSDFFKDNLKNRNVKVEKFNLEKEKINDLSFERSSWGNIGLLRCKVNNLEIRFCELAVCNLANSEFEDLFWQHSSMKNSKATGIDAPEAIIDGGEFIDCKLDLVNFKFSKITNTVFRDCQLQNADLQSAQLKNVKFLNCDLSNANFSQAEFKNIDLRRSMLSDTKIDIDNFKEITISPSQVIIVANALGLSIKD